ncbi:MAG TPA: NAD-binding protein [Abditibacteriaceae bacterium]
MNSPRANYTHRGLSDEDLAHLRETFFDIWRGVRSVMPATAFFAVIIVIATLGYIALGWQPFDAFYMVVITVFSVGYGETQPIDTVAERIWTILVIFGGWSAVVVTLGGITKSVTEGELRRLTDSIRKTRVMEHLHDHVIICGYGRMGQTLARELQDAGMSFVVIDRDEERVAQISVDGYLAHRGDATEESVLEYCGVQRAKTLATVLPQDALNVFITLTARDLSSDIKIIARGEQPSTEKKLLQAGADEVVLPATIGGLRIAHSITQPDVSELLRQKSGLDWNALGIEVDELRLHQHAHLLGKSVHEIHRLCNGEIMILGVRRNAEVLRENLDSLVLQEGDALVALARTQQLPAILARDVERTTMT